nr:ATP-binding protein [Paenalcaligenes hominis]
MDISSLLESTVAKAAVNTAHMNGFDPEAAIQAEIAKAQRAAVANRTEAYAQEVFKRAAIPPRFASRTLDNFIPHCDKSARALRVATGYAKNFKEVLEKGQSMIFVGNVGSGKTHLASGIAHEVIQQGHQALFSTVLGAVRTVKETYRRDSTKTESEAILELIEPDLLVLDEVGVQFGSDAEKLILFEIINGRYEHMKPTILLSNLNIEGLGEYLGERVMDRLREGGGKMIAFDWESYRRNV